MMKRPANQTATMLSALRNGSKLRAGLEDSWALALANAARAWAGARTGPSRRALQGAAVDEPGISVVIPSRQGRGLLERMLGAVEQDLRSGPRQGEIIVVDNGSTDGTAEFLRQRRPAARVEAHADPLSFSRAANRGAALARYSRLCLLNNDMEIEPGFFAALEAAFEEDPGLFCASAQIFFPEGFRREETGRTAMRRWRGLSPDDYPVFCDLPLAGESFSPVLYGSGGCSLFDRAKFLVLGGFDEFYQPAYVEDLDLGYRAWLRGWPSVFVAEARVLHHHRATSSRFYASAELEEFLERNHRRFLLRTVRSSDVFAGYYRHALARARRRGGRGSLSFGELAAAANPAPAGGHLGEQEILDLTGGGVRSFPGRRTGSGGGARLVSAGSTPASEARIKELAGSGVLCYLSYARPGAVPEAWLLDLCRVVTLVDGPAGSSAYRAALKEMRRRYSIGEVVSLEGEMD